MQNIGQGRLTWRKIAAIGLVGMTLGSSQMSAESDNIWAIDENGDMNYRVGVSTLTPFGTSWKRINGTATCIAAGPNGAVFSLNDAGVHYTTQAAVVANMNNPALWSAVTAGPVSFTQIVVTPDNGTLLGLGTDGNVYYNMCNATTGAPGTTWETLGTVSGAAPIYIAAGPDEAVYYIARSNGAVYFTAIPATATKIATWKPLGIESSGMASGISDVLWSIPAGDIFCSTPLVNAGNWEPIYGSDARSIAASPSGLVCYANAGGQVFYATQAALSAMGYVSWPSASYVWQGLSDGGMKQVSIGSIPDPAIAEAVTAALAAANAKATSAVAKAVAKACSNTKAATKAKAKAAVKATGTKTVATTKTTAKKVTQSNASRLSADELAEKKDVARLAADMKAKASAATLTADELAEKNAEAEVAAAKAEEKAATRRAAAAAARRAAAAKKAEAARAAAAKKVA